jgi:hypothetical protein
MDLFSQYTLPHYYLNPYGTHDWKYYPEVLHDVLQAHGMLEQIR